MQPVETLSLASRWVRQFRSAGGLVLLGGGKPGPRFSFLLVLHISQRHALSFDTAALELFDTLPTFPRRSALGDPSSDRARVCHAKRSAAYKGIEASIAKVALGEWLNLGIGERIYIQRHIHLFVTRGHRHR